MKHFLSFLLLIPFFTFSQNEKEENSIQATVTHILAEESLKNASLSFQVVDVSNDSILASYKPTTSLTPASIMKVVTTACALETFGSYKTFSTKLGYTGSIDSTGNLYGNIYIIGGGDPTLGSKYFLNKDEQPNAFMEEWLEAIKKLNIQHIHGRIIGDASIFSEEMQPSTWNWGDIGNYYGAGPSGLSIYDNLITLNFNSGKNSGDETEITSVTPPLPGISFYNKVKAANISNDQAYVYGAPYQKEKTIIGYIPKNRTNFTVKGAIHDPPYQAAYDFQVYLQGNNITIDSVATTTRINDTPLPKTTIFHTHTSPDLAQIAYWTNHISINLFAEHLLNLIGAKYSGEGSTSNGTNAVESFWSKRIDASGMYVNDGSGLSRQNAISAAHLTAILVHMTKSKYYKSFYSSLPIAGVSGTLSGIGRGSLAQNNIHAKSGTMTRVKSYTGYATTKSGREVAFAMILNNYSGNNSSATKKLEELMVAIANYNE